MNIIMTVKSDAFVSKMANAPAAMRRALLDKVTQLSVEVQRSVMEDKLTGQVLHVRTGTLRRSINREVQDRPDGVFAIIGTNLDYGIGWENGFTGNVKVAAHIRRQRTRLTYAQQYQRSGKVLKGKLTGLESMVQAHDRSVNMIARPFLRPTLEEFKPRILSELRKATLSVSQ